VRRFIQDSIEDKIADAMIEKKWLQSITTSVEKKWLTFQCN
jgi:ATP-dependent Clp protease ATP-binding subunit ClpA